MQTKTKYEEMVIKELRKIPEDSMPQVVKILRTLKSVSVSTKKEMIKESGLCGIWRDKRNAEEIIEEIHSHRSGFGSRRIKL